MKLILAFFVMATPVLADGAVVEDIRYSNGRFDVTLSHPDTGWDHYADGWRVELADGTVLGTRVLGHPHVQEQPFTRSSAIEIPRGIDELFIRASCNVDGWAEETTTFSDW